MPPKLPIVVLRHRRNAGDAAVCGARGHRLVFVMSAKLITCPGCIAKHEAIVERAR